MIRHKPATRELRILLLAGYDHARDGAIAMSADEAVREAVCAVFSEFALGPAGGAGVAR